MEVISRKEAKEQGLIHYFTGVPCKRGGIAKRLLSNGCCQCKFCKVVKNKIDVKSRIKNFEKNKNKIQRYRIEFPVEYYKKRRDHYEKNKEMYSNIRKKYELKNKDKVKKWSNRRSDAYSKSKV